MNSLIRQAILAVTGVLAISIISTYSAREELAFLSKWANKDEIKTTQSSVKKKENTRAPAIEGPPIYVEKEKEEKKKETKLDSKNTDNKKTLVRSR